MSNFPDSIYAVESIPKRKLTVDRLADAIRFTASEAIKSEAAKLGKNISKENGAADCARLIANCIAR